MFAYISGSSFVLQDIHGTSPQFFSMIFAINGIGIIIFSQITGRLAGQLSEKKLFIVGLCIASIGAISFLITILLNASLSVILVPLFFVISSIGIVNTAGSSLAMQNQGKSAGSASALLGVLMFVLGGSVAPLVGLGNNPELSMGIVIAFACLGSSLSYILMVGRRQAKLHQNSNSVSM